MKNRYRIVTAPHEKYSVEFMVFAFGFIPSGWLGEVGPFGQLEDARNYIASRNLENNFKPKVVE